MDKLTKFIDAYGATRFAVALGVSKGAVSHWRNGRFRVPPHRCREIAAISNGELTVHDIRPDVFGAAPSEAA